MPEAADSPQCDCFYDLHIIFQETEGIRDTVRWLTDPEVNPASKEATRRELISDLVKLKNNLDRARRRCNKPFTNAGTALAEAGKQASVERWDDVAFYAYTMDKELLRELTGCPQ